MPNSKYSFQTYTPKCMMSGFQLPLTIAERFHAALRDLHMPMTQGYAAALTLWCDAHERKGMDSYHAGVANLREACAAIKGTEDEAMFLEDLEREVALYKAPYVQPEDGEDFV